MPAAAATSSNVPSPWLRYSRFGCRLAADEQVEPAVVVVVGPGAALELTGSSRPASSVTSVKCRRRCSAAASAASGGRSQAPRGMKMSSMAVVVVVGLDAVQARRAARSGRPPRCGPRTCRRPCCGRRPSAAVGSNDVTTRSSRPSLSKSSMIAPPAWLKRLTPTRWPMSRNWPMSNSVSQCTGPARSGTADRPLRMFAQRHVPG